MNNDYFSTSVAKEELDKAIEKVTSEIADLEDALSMVDHRRGALNIQYEQKKKLLEVLTDKKNKIETLTGSYKLGENREDSASLYDKRIQTKSDKLNDTEKKLNSLNAKSKNALVRMEASRLKKKMDILKKKKGKMEARQRRFTKFKLSISSLKAKHEARMEGRRLGLENAVIDYHTIAEENKVAASDFASQGRYISSLKSKVDSISSYAKYDVLRSYLGVLKLKDGVVNGAKALPNNIKQALQANPNPARAR